MAWYGGLGALAGGISKGFQGQEPITLEQQQAKQQQQALLAQANALLGGLGNAPQSPMPGQASVPMQQQSQLPFFAANSPPANGGNYGSAIAGIESGGQSNPYAAMGPITNGDRPYGKYQVMGNNIPSWTQQALGQSMTPQQFLQSPQAQDQVFQSKFGQFQQQYGSPQAAAAVWHGGPGALQQGGGGASDNLGTTNDAYVQKFNQGLGQGGGQGNQLGTWGQSATPVDLYQKLLQQSAQQMKAANPNASPTAIMMALQTQMPMIREAAMAQYRQQNKATPNNSPQLAERRYEFDAKMAVEQEKMAAADKKEQAATKFKEVASSQADRRLAADKVREARLEKEGAQKNITSLADAMAKLQQAGGGAEVVPSETLSAVGKSVADQFNKSLSGQNAPDKSPIATVKTPEDVSKLPSGTRFLIPDGSGRIGVAP